MEGFELIAKKLKKAIAEETEKKLRKEAEERRKETTNRVLRIRMGDLVRRRPILY